MHSNIIRIIYYRTTGDVPRPPLQQTAIQLLRPLLPINTPATPLLEEER